MSNRSALDRVREAHAAIKTADDEAARLRHQARVDFGHVVNEVVASKEVKQEEVAAEIKKTREYVRRLQVVARDA